MMQCPKVPEVPLDSSQKSDNSAARTPFLLPVKNAVSVNFSGSACALEGSWSLTSKFGAGLDPPLRPRFPCSFGCLLQLPVAP